MLLLLTAACSTPQPTTVHLSFWAHRGTAAEQQALTDVVAGFNAQHRGIVVDLRQITEGDYNDVLQTAAAGDALPDVLDLDSPLVADYADQGVLRPLDPLLPDTLVAGLLDSVRTEGTWHGTLWALVWAVAFTMLGYRRFRRADILS